MAGKIQLELVTPAHRVLSQSVDEVQAPGADGSFGVLPGHTPFIARMRAGRLVAISGGEKLVFAVGEGFVQVAQDKVLVLTENADRAEEIDLAGANAEVDAETKKLLGLTQDAADYELQRAKVERAAARVLVADKR
jgi:F-type H+-transporting ATPase subunit epsilon